MTQTGTGHPLTQLMIHSCVIPSVLQIRKWVQESSLVCSIAKQKLLNGKTRTWIQASITPKSWPLVCLNSRDTLSPFFKFLIEWRILKFYSECLKQFTKFNTHDFIWSYNNPLKKSPILILPLLISLLIGNHCFALYTWHLGFFFPLTIS